MSARPRPASPGPGSHDIALFPDKSPSSLLSNSAAFSISGGGPRGCNKSSGRRVIGPGAHHPKYMLTERRHAGHGFGKQRRFNGVGCSKTERTPASTLDQGDNHNFKKQPQYSFGQTELGVAQDGKGKLGRGVRMPAPGDHNPDDRCSSQVRSSPAYSATPRRGADEPVKKEKGPGPGSYPLEDLEKTKAAAPRMVFGSAARDPPSQAERRGHGMPGPGRYGVSGKTRTGHSSLGSSPGWTMAGRTGDAHLAYL